MADETLQQIVLAALLHDIGKLLERGEVFSEVRDDPHYTGFCPAGPGGRPTHLHGAHTRRFCDWLEERFECLQNFPRNGWKDWCAGHHQTDKGPQASAVRIADRLSAREREPGEYYRRQIHQKTRLEPVLERINLTRDDRGIMTRYRYRLCRMEMEKTRLFPVLGEELGAPAMPDAQGGLDDPKQWRHLLAEKPLIEEYAALCRGLMDEIEALSRQHPDLSADALIRSLLTLLERYTANVPSATNVRHPDISLFDHLRTAAAIAQALWDHHREEERFPTVLAPNDETPRWLLVCGDFSGIQKFIYNLTNKGAAKGLRGRSFYVGWFCRLCGDLLLSRMGLTRAALLYNSGGKFYLLIPKRRERDLYKVREEINQWLAARFGGEVFFGLGIAGISGAMFEQGRMSRAWKIAAEDLERDRMRRFSELMTPEFFDPEADFDPSGHCKVCGSRGARIKEGEKCDSCAALEGIGIGLKNADALLTVWGDDARREVERRLKNGQGLSRFAAVDALGAHLFFLRKSEMEKISDAPLPDAECVLLNELADQPFDALKLPGCAISTQYLGKWEQRRQVDEEGLPWDFDDYADHAEGIPRLGILRMDVDNLGMVFIRGLDFPERDPVVAAGVSLPGWGDVKRENGVIRRRQMASLSRMVTLSRQLNSFFSGYVPGLLNEERFNRCQVIYAGGDDLFVIGSWDQLPELAKTIRTEFGRFCCGNPDFTISGGITLQRGRYPIYKGAQLAGSAENAAKRVRGEWNREGNPLAKDGFCFLGVSMLWEDMVFAEKIRERLAHEIRENRGLLSFLLTVAGTNRMRVQALMNRKGMGLARAWGAVEYGPWRWRTAYRLRRRYSDDETRKIWSDILFASQFDGEASKLPVHSWMELPLRWIDYLKREKGGK